MLDGDRKSRAEVKCGPATFNLTKNAGEAAVETAASAILCLNPKLELLCQADVNEAPGWIVKKARVFRGIAPETIRFRRILPENVAAAQRDSGVVESTFPDWDTVVRGLRDRAFGRLSVFAARDILGVLGISGYRLLFDRRSENEVVRSLTIEGPSLAYPVVMSIGQ